MPQMSEDLGGVVLDVSGLVLHVIPQGAYAAGGSPGADGSFASFLPEFGASLEECVFLHFGLLDQEDVRMVQGY